MKKNIYFRNVIKRENVAKKILLHIFYQLASFPRLVLEVFIRKNFGERYFNLASVLSVALIIALLPAVLYNLPTANGHGFWPFLVRYATWYVFLGLFLYHCWQRWREIQKSSSSFDFTRFSLYAGDINPWFQKIRLSGTGEPSIRTIETLYEPGIFFVGGVVLWVFGQSIGVFICIASVFYSLSYVAAYWQGDNFILDRIDEIIFNEEMARAFVDDMPAEDTRGVRFHTRKPGAKTLRRKITDAMQDDGADDAAEVE
jgi:hypothetical protein